MRLVIACLLLAACEGPAGPPGAPATPGDATLGDASNIDAILAPWATQPGIAVAITALAFTGSVATVSFTLSDGAGTAVDPAGVLSDGVVALGFVLAQLAQNADGSAAQYTAYTTTIQTSPITGTSATQGATESSGVLHAVDVAQGTYRYDFAAALTGLDPTLTQTVAASAVRGANFARDTFSARPDGGEIAVREVVTSAPCESCHRALDGHGGRWTKTTQCVLCHQPQSSDPDTGNTVDFKVMIHEIHDGASLPSVIAGTPYQIIGHAQVVSDFSTVVFPQNIARCTACHVGAEADHWQTAPSKAACTSCHDLTSFVQPTPAGMVLHGGGTQPDNAMCAVCHPSSGGLAGIADAHLTGLLSPTAPIVTLAILAMTNTAPGQLPVITFQALVDGVPRDLIAQPLTALTATIAGPTTDYATEWAVKILPAGTLAVVDASQEIFSYAFATPIPATATGSYTVGLEGYLQPTPADARYAAVNPTFTFGVTDAVPRPRRAVVSRAECNGCHFDLSAHGGARKSPEYCVLCHNTTLYDAAGAPQFEGSSNVLAEALDFRHFIHKIHAGDQLTEPFVIGGFPLPTVANPAGTQNDFGAIRYPRDLVDCAACHTSKNWTLPMTASIAYAPSTSALMTCTEPAAADTNNFCNPPFWVVAQTTLIGAQASVCTSCHDTPDIAAHAQLNTTPAGLEACAACHGPGTTYDVGVLHGLP